MSTNRGAMTGDTNPRGQMRVERQTVRRHTDWCRQASRARMNARKPSQLPSEPPPAVTEALRNRLSGRELEAFGAVFAVRTTAQLMANAITEWMANLAGSPARFQILMLLWAASGRGVPHKEIVAAHGVTRATVSGLMAALERDGLVTSAVASDDRRNLLARLTPKGEATVEKALEINKARLRAAFTALSSDEVTTLTTLLQRVRQGFAVSAVAAEGHDGSRASTSRRAVQMKAPQDIA
jgi:DNA-binding MarR family transcriptional regulator